MDAMTRRAANVLRAVARRHIQQAADMVEQADELDPPPPRPDHSVRSICRTCGTEYRGREYGPGQPCESCEEAGRTGYLRRVKADSPRDIPDEDWNTYIKSYGDEPDEPLTTTDGRSLVSWSSYAVCLGCSTECSRKGYLETKGTCPSCGREYTPLSEIPDEMLRTKDGRSLGVTRDELAMSQAAQNATADDLMMADLEELSDRRDDDCLDIASTYRGGRA